MTRGVLFRGGLALLLMGTLAGVLLWLWPGVEMSAPEAPVTVPASMSEDGPVARRTPVFPVADEARLAFEDFPFAGVDERSSYRQFSIPLRSGKLKYLATTYLDEPDWVDDRQDDEALITRLADQNAVFTSNALVDLPPQGNWSQIRLHIGDFAQDYCGELVAVVSFRNARIFATTDVPSADLDLAASQCPLRPEAFLADKVRYGKREEPDDFSAFCAVRRECLQAYFGKPESQVPLPSGWLAEVAGVVLR